MLSLAATALVVAGLLLASAATSHASVADRTATMVFKDGNGASAWVTYSIFRIHRAPVVRYWGTLYDKPNDGKEARIIRRHTVHSIQFEVASNSSGKPKKFGSSSHPLEVGSPVFFTVCTYYKSRPQTCTDRFTWARK